MNFAEFQYMHAGRRGNWQGCKRGNKQAMVATSFRPKTSFNWKCPQWTLQARNLHHPFSHQGLWYQIIWQSPSPFSWTIYKMDPTQFQTFSWISTLLHHQCFNHNTQKPKKEKPKRGKTSCSDFNQEKKGTEKDHATKQVHSTPFHSVPFSHLLHLHSKKLLFFTCGYVWTTHRELVVLAFEFSRQTTQKKKFVVVNKSWNSKLFCP